MRQQLIVIVSQINEKLQLLDTDSIPTSSRSIVNAIKQLNQQCEDILNSNNKATRNIITTDVVTTTASLNHLSSVEFESMMKEIDAIGNSERRSGDSSVIEKILDNAIETAQRMVDDPLKTAKTAKTAKTHNTTETETETQRKQETEKNDTESKTEIKNELELELETYKKEDPNSSKDSTSTDDAFVKEYANVDLSIKLSDRMKQESVTEIENEARKLLIAACVADNPSKIIEILEHLWRYHIKMLDLDLGFVNWSDVFCCDKDSWRKKYHKPRGQASDVKTFVNSSPILTAMRLKRFECLRTLLDTKYNHRNVDMCCYYGVETNVYLYLINGDCDMVEIIGEYIIRSRWRERHNFNFFGVGYFYLFSRFNDSDVRNLRDCDAKDKKLWRGENRIENWINDYSSNKDNNIIRYNFMSLKYGFILSKLRKHDNQLDRPATVDDKNLFEETVKGESMDIFFMLLNQIGSGQSLSFYNPNFDRYQHQLFDICINIILNKKYNKTIYQPLCNSIGIDSNNIIKTFEDLNGIKSNGRRLLRKMLFDTRTHRTPIMQTFEQTMAKLVSNKEIIDGSDKSDKKNLIDCHFLNVNEYHCNTREDDTLLLEMIEWHVNRKFEYFSVSKQIENFIRYNGIIYDFNFKQLINSKSRTKVYSDKANSGKYKAYVETPLSAMLSRCYSKGGTSRTVDILKLILSHKPDISMQFSMIDFALIQSIVFPSNRKEIHFPMKVEKGDKLATISKYKDKKCSIIEAAFDIFCPNTYIAKLTGNDDIPRQILGLFMDCSNDLAYDLFDYVSPITNTNIFINMLNSTCDIENPLVLVQLVFKKLFFRLDGTRKIWQLLDQKSGEISDTSAIENAQWRSKEVFSFIEQMYSASKNNDVTKMGALLNVVVANQQRAIEQFEKFTQQNMFANLFIQKFGMLS